jgi:PPOX class probable F420-dependent enzyme
MDLADALQFITQNSHTVLATRRRDGGVQMSPVDAGVIDGRVVISSRAMLAKVHNIRRDLRVSALVLNPRFYGSWVQIDGVAEIVDQPDALPLLDEVYRMIAGEHPDWAEYRAAMITDRRVVIRISPERASGILA